MSGLRQLQKITVLIARNKNDRTRRCSYGNNRQCRSQSRSLCFEALHAARAGNFDEAKQLLHEADGYSRQAHHMQTKLIEQDAGEARQPMTLIMVHAQDHLMTSMLARELAEEIIHLYQR